MYTQYLTLSSISLQLKKCLRIPICDFALFILASISAFSVRQGAMIDPKYLNYQRIGCGWLHCLGQSFQLGTSGIQLELEMRGRTLLLFSILHFSNLHASEV